MQARDVMTSPVITVKPTSTVKETAKLFLERRISAAPVVDDQGKLVGIISEGDLMHRSEIGTERQRAWWLTLMADEKGRAADYIKAHAKRVGDVMTGNVITAAPQTPLSEIAMILEQNAIKRLPIVHGDQIVGIVSHANLVQAVASSGSKLDIPLSDTTIRDKLLAHLKTQRWVHTDLFNATVNDGIVDLWGITGSESERKAIRVAAETTSGVRAVNDRMIVMRLLAVA
ncbi:MAG TPA: CBS domain-containing protein [Xanthobacteraceae bacterium]|nr:CBS domain-containing protein [Xanthobacteraceae bacterium]